MGYYQKEIECMPQEKLRELQSERLAKQVRHAWYHVPYYQKKMQMAGVTPGQIRSVEDLKKLPMLKKDDLRKAYPYGLLGVSLDDCVRVHSTSGTTGKRVLAFYTQADLDLWSDCCARALAAAGTTQKDLVQICYGYGLFTGGLGIHGGSEKLGALTVPMSSGNTDRQIQFMEDLGTTVLCCTPSYAEYLAECVEKADALDRLKLKAGIFGAEAWTEEMRADIERRLHIQAYDIYGLTELSGPGVAFGCSAHAGMHLNEDHFIAEIIDPETNELLPDGSVGELVLTSITKEAFPLIRYRTRDLCTLTHETCSCGRTFARISKPMGRTDDMLIIRGVNVFPSQVETVLLEQGYEANYQIVVDRVGATDTFEVLVEMNAGHFSDSLREITQMEKELVGALRMMLGITATVKLVAPGSIERSEGKAKRVIDRRKLV